MMRWCLFLLLLGSGFACEATSEDCTYEEEAGSCDGDMLTFCLDGEEFTEDCAESGCTCEVEETADAPGEANCICPE